MDSRNDQFETPSRIRAIQTQDGEEWAFVERRGPQRRISHLSWLPLMLAFALGTVTATVGLYAFVDMAERHAPLPVTTPITATAMPASLLSPMPAPPSAPTAQPIAVEAPPVLPKASAPANERPKSDELSASEVWEAQLRLGFLGMKPGSVDGVVGSQTSAAVRRYEGMKGQPQTGKLGRDLLELLRAEPGVTTAMPASVASPLAAPPALQPPPVEAGPVTPKASMPATERPDPNELSYSEVWEVQLRLKVLGMQPGTVDGAWRPQTIAAIKRYEEANGRPQTGVLDRELLERLRRDPKN
jgi:peptidoglycan hydrolase-like protein with peptidoglycan-binding domain